MALAFQGLFVRGKCVWKDYILFCFVSAGNTGWSLREHTLILRTAVPFGGALSPSLSHGHARRESKVGRGRTNVCSNKATGNTSPQAFHVYKGVLVDPQSREILSEVRGESEGLLHSRDESGCPRACAHSTYTTGVLFIPSEPIIFQFIQVAPSYVSTN